METAVARAALVALALIGCHHARPTLYGEPVPDGCSADGPIGDEACMGWYVDRTKMLGKDEYEDRNLAHYVASVGERVVRATGDRRDWQFRVLDDSDPQAEANISTTVYITRGAIGRLRDEAELAALLGHEIGHVVAGHARDAIEEFNRGTSTSPRDVRAERDDEIQADELAVLFTARAGYDPRAVETMLRALAAGDPDEEDASDTHPRWTERLARVQAFAMQLPARGERRPKEYLAHIAHLVYGVDPRAVALGKTAGLFARAHVAVDFPRGWTGAVAYEGKISVVLPDDVSIVMYVIPRAAASTVKLEATREKVVDGVPVGNQLLVVTVTGDYGVAKTAAAVRAAVRAPTAAELAALVPRRVDLAAKRRLWPEPLSESKDLSDYGLSWVVPTASKK
jgi:predicted Zn-dependent protease